MPIREIKPFEGERLGWMAATFESVSDLVFISDLEDRILYVNPAALEKLGYQKEEMIGQKGPIMMSPKYSKAFRRQLLEKTLKNTQGWEGEVLNMTKSGREFLVHLKTALIRNKRGAPIGMTGISRDITEEMKNRQELERYAKKLEEVNQMLHKTRAQLVRSEKLAAIGELASGVAHEVGNPLASLSSLIQLLQRKVSEARTLKRLQQMQNHVARIHAIIHKVSIFSEQDSRELAAVDLTTLVRNVVQRICERRKNKNIEVVTLIPNRVPRVRGDAGQLSEVFSNMLLNAWDAIDQKGEIRVSMTAVNDRVCVSIQDNGRGIPKKDLKKIFEPFFTTKEVGQGTGMGLAVSYGLIKSFGGEIRIESIVGRGTKFDVYLVKHKQREDGAHEKSNG